MRTGLSKADLQRARELWRAQARRSASTAQTSPTQTSQDTFVDGTTGGAPERAKALSELSALMKTRASLTPEALDRLSADASSGLRALYDEVVKLKAEGRLERVRGVEHLSDGLVTRLTQWALEPRSGGKIKEGTLLNRDAKGLHKVACLNVASLFSQVPLDGDFQARLRLFAERAHGVTPEALDAAQERPALSTLEQDERAANALMALLLGDLSGSEELRLPPALRIDCIERLGMCGDARALALLERYTPSPDETGTSPEADQVALARALGEAKARIADQASMSFVFGAYECAPRARTGGLGTVLYQEALALARLGHKVVNVMPRHGFIDVSELPQSAQIGEVRVDTHDGQRAFVAYEESGGHENVKHLWIDDRPCEPERQERALFSDRSVVYDPEDALGRQSFFAQAALEVAGRLFGQQGPHALIGCDKDGALLTVGASRARFERTVAGYVSHNALHQGITPMDQWGQVWLSKTPASGHLCWVEPEHPVDPGTGMFEFHGNLNPSKAAVVAADVVVGVSPTNMRELASDPEASAGLNGVVAKARLQGKTAGRLNGINLEEWNPETQELLPAKYGPEDLSGKAQCKAALREKYGLRDADVPVIGMVTRLDRYQKNLDAVREAIRAVMTEAGPTPRCQFVILGSGDVSLARELDALARELDALAREFPGWVAFDPIDPDILTAGDASRMAAPTPEAEHLIIAGSDFYLMPSAVEPCGQPQMYAKAYGTPPLVSRTGGLNDSVQLYDERTKTGTGFIRELGPRVRSTDSDAERAEKLGQTTREVLGLLDDAIGLYRRGPRAMQPLIQNCMRSAREDHSWERAAKETAAIMRRRLNGRPLHD